ncbi:MAG TPA: glutathione S-transferase family protein [Polyangiaceae bacterium]|nr:glutathione S-transferase family protein [Polyangiaceae bacterium]
MSDEITFYYNPLSRGRITHWMLEEVGAPYRIELLSFEKREHKRPEFLAINPMGKLPAIVHRGVVVTEAAATCAYLADAFPGAGLAPALDDPARGTYLRWMFFGAGCVEPALVDKMFSRPPAERPSSLGYGTYDDTMNALEQAVSSGPCILGERFSAADVYIASQIGWGLLTKSIEPRPAFQAYVGRHAERPAFKRFAAKSTELAEALKARGG